MKIFDKKIEKKLQEIEERAKAEKKTLLIASISKRETAAKHKIYELEIRCGAFDGYADMCVFTNKWADRIRKAAGEGMYERTGASSGITEKAYTLEQAESRLSEVINKVARNRAIIRGAKKNLTIEEILVTENDQEKIRAYLI